MKIILSIKDKAGHVWPLSGPECRVWCQAEFGARQSLVPGRVWCQARFDSRQAPNDTLSLVPGTE